MASCYKSFMSRFSELNGSAITLRVRLFNRLNRKTVVELLHEQPYYISACIFVNIEYNVLHIGLLACYFAYTLLCLHGICLDVILFAYYFVYKVICLHVYFVFLCSHVILFTLFFFVFLCLHISLFTFFVVSCYFVYILFCLHCNFFTCFFSCFYVYILFCLHGNFFTCFFMFLCLHVILLAY